MNNPSQEDLLGYILGALDATEQRNIQQQIDQNPQLEEELLRIKSSLVPLDELDSGGSRPGLARRTCEAIATYEKSPSAFQRSETPEVVFSKSVSMDSLVATAVASADASNESLNQENDEDVKLSPALRERIFVPSTWSMSDMLVGCALMAVMVSLLFPFISQSRFNSRVLACQNNLTNVGVAMMKYSDINDGMFVTIPSGGNLAASGCYAPLLKDAGLIEDDTAFACAGIASTTPPVHIPSIQQLNSDLDEEQLNHLRRSMGGHYGYTMGYCEDNRYCPPRNMGRTCVVLLADQPSVELEGRQSTNHSGKGQNLLFEDGHIEFVTMPSYAGDALFENDYGIVAPGSHCRDNVIAPSHLAIRLDVVQLHSK